MLVVAGLFEYLLRYKDGPSTGSLSLGSNLRCSAACTPGVDMLAADWELAIL